MPARRESPARQHSPNCRHHPMQLNGRFRPVDTPCNEALIPMLRLFNVVNPRFSTMPCVVELVQEIRHWQLARSTDQSASASMAACPVCTSGVLIGLPANLSSTIQGTLYPQCWSFSRRSQFQALYRDRPSTSCRVCRVPTRVQCSTLNLTISRIYTNEKQGKRT